MGRRSHTRALALWMNGERVGTWNRSPAGDELAYSDAWLASPRARPLSLSLPFRPGNAPWRGLAVGAWFENLLPDSAPIRERIARRFRAASTSAFDLLAEIGRECAGAVQIVAEGEVRPPARRIDARPLDEAAVAKLLRHAVAPAVPGAPAGDDDADFRISIAGAQEKTALLWHEGRWWRPEGATPTTHILKLPLGLAGNTRLDLRHSVQNEWLSAELLRAFGLPVARSHPLVFEDQHVLAVERFDRRWAGGGAWLFRLPQEDLCQATATPPFMKYEADGGPGIDRILELLNGSDRRQQDRETFFRAQLLFWLLCAADGHAKNFSIALHAGGGFALTPLYDVLSFHPMFGAGPGKLAPQRVRMAMAVRSKNAHWRMREITRRHWAELGRRHGIVDAEGRGVDTVIDAVAGAVAAVVDDVSARLPAGFPASVAEAIFAGLKSNAAHL
jgi:serine/threonine-protein kinase HipA